MTAQARGNQGGHESPDAIVECRHFPACSGCQHIGTPYEEQLARKLDRVRTMFTESALPAFNPITLRTIHPSPVIHHYRNRAKLAPAREEGRDATSLGLYRAGTHEVVDIPGCPVQHPLLNAVADTLRDALSTSGISLYDEVARTGDLRYVSLRVGVRTGQWLAGFVTAVGACHGLDTVVEALKGMDPPPVGIVQHVNDRHGNAIFAGENRTLHGRDYLEESVAGVTVRLGLTSFFQVNTDVAELAYGAILRNLQLDRRAYVLDLYAGVGAIGLAAAGSVHRVVGIEASEEAVELAKDAASANGIGNCDFKCGTVEGVLPDVVRELAGLGVTRSQLNAVLNPPRKGVDADVLDKLIRIGPPRIAYLSCHPRSLLRDLAHLTADAYTVRQVELFDMFPQTDQVETLAVLERRRQFVARPHPPKESRAGRRRTGP